MGSRHGDIATPVELSPVPETNGDIRAISNVLRICTIGRVPIFQTHEPGYMRVPGHPGTRVSGLHTASKPGLVVSGGKSVCVLVGGPVSLLWGFSEV